MGLAPGRDADPARPWPADVERLAARALHDRSGPRDLADLRAHPGRRGAVLRALVVPSGQAFPGRTRAALHVRGPQSGFHEEPAQLEERRAGRRGPDQAVAPLLSHDARPLGGRDGPTGAAGLQPE